MIELQKEGLIKSIGVCNFQIHHLQRLIDETGVTPVINQIELHPLMQQRQLHAWNATHKIQTELEPISARRERRFRSESHSRSGR